METAQAILFIFVIMADYFLSDWSVLQRSHYLSHSLIILLSIQTVIEVAWDYRQFIAILMDAGWWHILIWRVIMLNMDDEVSVAVLLVVLGDQLVELLKVQALIVVRLVVDEGWV